MKARKKMTTLEFIRKARQVHGDLYDYSKSVYHGPFIPIIIIDPVYGEFKQRPSNHLFGRGNFHRGRAISAKKQMISQTEFIEKALKQYGFKRYSYDEIAYQGFHIPVKIICLICNKAFYQEPANHLQGKEGCKLCANNNRSLNERFSQDDFLRKARNNWPNKEYPDVEFDYSKSIYKGMRIPLLIKCKIHDREFYQSPDSHLRGYNGCKDCRYTRVRIKMLEKVKKEGRYPMSINPKGTDFINKLSMYCNIKIIHEYRIEGYIVDGYCADLNIVIEFDEKHHYLKNGKLRKKDISRQLLITQITGCCFIRVKQSQFIENESKTITTAAKRIFEWMESLKRNK